MEINSHPPARELRQFACLWMPAVLAASGAVALLKASSPALAAACWGVALTVAVAGATAPGLVRPVYLAWMYASYALGRTVSYVLLAAIYFLLITPISLVARLGGYDSLTRGFDRSARSYWTARNRGVDLVRYFRQF